MVQRMSNGYACYGPPASAPEVGPLPSLASGQFTFGSFSNPAKLSNQILDVWAEVLRQLPKAQLLLKYGGLDNPQLQDRARAALGDRGIAPDRIFFEGWSPNAELLACYNRVDLALDTLPYSGGLTTCEAIWMGVPVITCPGNTFAGRHATSHLHNSGYSQFVADSLAGYIYTAIHWAQHPVELAEIRERVRRSALCDAEQFATDFLSALSQAFTAKKQ